MIETALAFLSRDTLSHIEMIEVIRRANAQIFYAENDGVLLREKNSGTWMMTAQNKAAAEKMIEQIDAVELITFHQLFCKEMLTKKFNFTEYHACYQAAWLQKTPPLREDNFSIRILDESYTEVVNAAYHSMEDPDYIRSRLQAKAILGAFENDVLAGFIGSHGEGSMGILEVFPSFRRRGLATALEKAEIAHEMAQGWVPFCQVYEENASSYALQQKLGMTFAQSQMYWLF